MFRRGYVTGIGLALLELLPFCQLFSDGIPSINEVEHSFFSFITKFTCLFLSAVPTEKTRKLSGWFSKEKCKLTSWTNHSKHIFILIRLLILQVDCLKFKYASLSIISYPFFNEISLSHKSDT